VDTGDPCLDEDGDGATTCDGDCDDDDPSLNLKDVDGDGHSTCDADCDDGDARTFPGVAIHDSGTACMTDQDGDGYGTDSPSGGIAAGTDCNDAAGTINPGASDTPWDGIDQDCTGGDAGSTQSNSTSPAKVITDYTTVTSTLSMVSCATVYGITVDLDITHTFIRDLTIALRSPSGTLINLHDKTGGASDDIIGTYAMGGGGSLSAAEPLTGFLSDTGTGSWRLTVADDGWGDSGLLNSWGITLDCP
jgi:subtilisin-like proprotein convertase family protein